MTILNDRQFRELLDLFERSWPGYRKVRRGVMKKIRRHMRDVSLTSFNQYLAALKTRPELERQCRGLLFVSISRFFRDIKLWNVIKDEIFSEVAGHKGGKAIRAWSAGCACGEEVYSLKIVHQEARRNLGLTADLEVLGTDANPASLARAKTGKYPESSLREIPPNLRKAYFNSDQEPGDFEVIESLREEITWSEHNLLESPPATGFDLVFIRNNLLTYYAPALEKPALNRIVKAVRPGGYIIVGSHEAPPENSEITRQSAHPCIYRRQ